ncbi:hypothetical protein D3C76_711670 [compost metagenome]
MDSLGHYHAPQHIDGSLMDVGDHLGNIFMGQLMFAHQILQCVSSRMGVPT